MTRDSNRSRQTSQDLGSVQPGKWRTVLTQTPGIAIMSITAHVGGQVARKSVTYRHRCQAGRPRCRSATCDREAHQAFSSRAPMMLRSSQQPRPLSGRPGPSGESRNCGVRAATRPHLPIEERELEAAVSGPPNESKAEYQAEHNKKRRNHPHHQPEPERGRFTSSSAARPEQRHARVSTPVVTCSILRTRFVLRVRGYGGECQTRRVTPFAPRRTKYCFAT